MARPDTHDDGRQMAEDVPQGQRPADPIAHDWVLLFVT